MLPLKTYARIKLRARHSVSVLGLLFSPNLKLFPTFRWDDVTEKEQLLSNISSLEDVENLVILGVHVGDLLYDEYLRHYDKYTLDWQSNNFQVLFSEYFNYVQEWKALVDNDKVQAICISHHVYKWAIPLRVVVASGKDIPIYLINGESLNLLKEGFLNPFELTKSYRENFRELDDDAKQKGTELAEKQLQRKLIGESNLDDIYPDSAFRNRGVDLTGLIANNGRRNILIAVHDFYDAPHVYGKNLFPDFYCWIESIGQFSLKTNYNWYIKTHPFLHGRGEDVVRNFLRKFPHIRIIDSQASHHDLIKQGINLVLTVYGTIASEYPYLGVPVLNASINNPHSGYTFSRTPQTLDEYFLLLENPDLIKIPEDAKEQILEYYFMHHLFKLKSILFYAYDVYLEDLGGYSTSMSKKVFPYFISSKNSRKFIEITDALENFLESGSKRLERIHFRS